MTVNADLVRYLTYTFEPDQTANSLACEMLMLFRWVANEYGAAANQLIPCRPVGIGEDRADPC